jgi:hypothetical protein
LLSHRLCLFSEKYPKIAFIKVTKTESGSRRTGAGHFLFAPTKTRTFFAKSSQRFLKVAAHYVPVSKGIKPARIERLTMKNSRTAVAALLIAGFALTSTTTSFAAETAATKAERVAARTAFQAQMNTFKAAAEARHTAADAAHATIDAARATAKAAEAAATTADQKAAAKAAFESAKAAAKATVPAKPVKPVKPAILVKAKPAVTPGS